MTPYELTVFLHHAASHDQFIGKDGPIYPETIEKLTELGLLEYHDPRDSDWDWRRLDK